MIGCVVGGLWFIVKVSSSLVRVGHLRLEMKSQWAASSSGGQLVICIGASFIHLREPSVDAGLEKYLDYLSGVLRGPELVSLVAFSVDPNNFDHCKLQRLFTRHILEGPYS